MRASLRCWKCAWCQNGLIMRILAGGCTRERAAQLFGRLSFVCLLGYRWCANHVLHARFFVMININQYFTIWLLFIQPIHISVACVYMCTPSVIYWLISLRRAPAHISLTACVAWAELSECAHSIFLFYQLSRRTKPFSLSLRPAPSNPPRCSAPPASQLCLFWIMRRAPMKIKPHIFDWIHIFVQLTLTNGKFEVRPLFYIMWAHL